MYKIEKLLFEGIHDDPFTHGAAVARVSRHDGEKAYEGLGTGYGDFH